MEGFIKIPNAILQDKELNHTQMLLYGYIMNLSNKKGYCWAKNKVFAEYLNVDDRTVQRHLNKLKERGYIEIKLEENNRDRIVTLPGQNCHTTPTELSPSIYRGKENIKEDIKEIDKEFENFWKLFPHARKGKKQDAKKFYTQINDPVTVIKEVKHLKLKIQAGVEEGKYVPACERWIRDFTPISDEVKVKDLERIMKRHLTTEGAKERYSDLVEVYGEERVKAMAKKISQTLDFNKPKDVQI